MTTRFPNQRCPVIAPIYQLAVLDFLLPRRLVLLIWIVATYVHRGCHHRTCAHTKIIRGRAFRRLEINNLLF